MTSRPNILVVMSDEQSWNTMGCTGNAAAQTPNLDRLCEESTSFDRAYTPFPLCCPSRTSLWTGRMPRHHGVLGNWRPVMPHLREAGVAQAFRRAGYHTIYNGKWHVPGTTPNRMGWADTSAIPAVIAGQDRGRYIPDYRAYAGEHGYEFDERHIENLTQADITATIGPGTKPYATASVDLDHFLETWQTGEFLRAFDARPDGQPWLATCSFNAPHFPMIVPAPYDRLINRAAVTLPDSWADGTSTVPAEVQRSHYATDYADLTETEWVELTAHYLGLCALIDTQLGRIREHLESVGEWDNTIVVFTTDHGDMMGAHRLMEKGHLLHYEEDLRIPMFIRHPDAVAARTDNLVSMCDVGATLAELADVAWDEDHDGISFAATVGRANGTPTRNFVTAETTLAAGKPGGAGEPFFAEHWTFPRDSLNLSVRTPQDRYVFRSDDVDELYDHRVDPGERVNLATHPDQQTRRRELRSLLVAEIGDSFTGAAELLNADRDPADNLRPQ